MNMMFRALQADYILVFLFYCILEEPHLCAFFPLEYCRLEHYISTWSRVSFAVEQQLLRQRFICATDDMCYVPSLLKIDKFLDFPGFAQPKNMFVRHDAVPLIVFLLQPLRFIFHRNWQFSNALLKKTCYCCMKPFIRNRHSIPYQSHQQEDCR